MKKVIVLFISFIVIFVAAGCSKDPASIDLLRSTKEIYGFEAVSSISLLGSMDNDYQQSPLSNNAFNYASTNLGYKKEVTEDEINEINKYLGIMEQMLADGKPISIANETSDRAEYNNKMVISTSDLNLNNYNYVLYYNEVILNEDEEANSDEEIESSLEGIMVVVNQEYIVSGKKELEENEMKIEFTSKIDDDNWVTVKQKTEDNEKKFEYTISENGVISVTEIKYEVEDNETKLKLEFKQGDNSSEYIFKIEEEDEKKVIKIDIQDGNTKLEVKVFVILDQISGETSYEYRVKDSNKSFFKERKIEHDDISN
jgi:hypothetical protein